MSHILQDRVLQQTTTTGTGDITLGLAVQGFRAIADVCAVGDTIPYFIEAIDDLGQPTGAYEYGVGTFATGNKLQRTTVLGSSNGGALVVFGAGTKNVGLGLLSAHMQYGNNASGAWIRHPNGVMEQWGFGFAGASNSVYVNTFPQQFISPPVVTAMHAGGDASVNIVEDAASRTATQFGLRSNYGSTVGCPWRAIGRWIA